MLTNHTFALTTPSWNIKLLEKQYQIYCCLSTKIDIYFSSEAEHFWSGNGYLRPEHSMQMHQSERSLCPESIPAGMYLHLYSSDSFWERASVQEQFLEYAEKNGLCLSDKAIVISKIDYSITDVPSELLYEFQIRVSK